jgi:hypothetical protein
MPVITRSQKKIVSNTNVKKETNTKKEKKTKPKEISLSTWFKNTINSYLDKIKAEEKSKENTFNDQYINLMRLKTEVSYIINEYMDDVFNELPDAIKIVGLLKNIILLWLAHIKVQSCKIPTQCETIAVNEMHKAVLTLSKYQVSQKQKIGLDFSAEDEYYDVYEEDDEDDEEPEEEEKEDKKDEDYDPNNEEDRLQVLEDLEDDKNFYDFVVEENKDW